MVYFVDGMSTFGAVPLNLTECNIDYMVSSTNKCIQECLASPLLFVVYNTLFNVKVSAIALGCKRPTNYEEQSRKNVILLCKWCTSELQISVI